jgi:hypothetical protein
MISELRGQGVNKPAKPDDQEIIFENNPRVVGPQKGVHQFQIPRIVFPQADRRRARSKPHQGREGRPSLLDNIQQAGPGDR